MTSYFGCETGPVFRGILPSFRRGFDSDRPLQNYRDSVPLRRQIIEKPYKITDFGPQSDRPQRGQLDPFEF